ncbi:MAG: hypothetical protein CL693_07030 [Cellvibrionaceae bacterium]|nr:hypothetical protein [Cellvibrionaceae bacterium]
MKKWLITALSLSAATGVLAQDGSTQLLWGDTHLHTKLSADAYLMGNRSLSPDDAYRYAKGLPVVNAQTKHRIQINTPLDFLAVTDHDVYMGVIPKLFAGDPSLVKTKEGKKLYDMVQNGEAQKAFFDLVASVNSNKPLAALDTKEIRQTVWQEEIISAAEKHNQPGKFTTLIGWEWSSLPNGANLHRVVLVKDGADIAKKFVPYSTFDSDKPEDFWNWMEKTSAQTGADFLAIPHNGNVSKGQMFNDVDSYGKPLTAKYAKTRMRWEPVYEMTQIKGDGETLAALSPDDPFAEFETYNHALDGREGSKSALPPDPNGYARSALMRGLEYDKKLGVNPFKLGMIGASDSHSGVSAVEEDNFGGKFPLDSNPEGKSKSLTPGTIGYDMASAGLAGVWATENTREAIFNAFKRREVYGTTGPRIQLRFFGGWGFQAKEAEANNLADIGYRKGVPMGGDMTQSPSKKAPSFLIHAAKDPIDANLDRVQVVKGWLDKNGQAREKVYNVAASEGRKINNNQLAPVGNTVDLETATYTNSIGSAQLATVWKDPDFDPSVRAFYYIRVLQIPTPRHTLYAEVALKQSPKKGYLSTIQERAYSSPIWYTP